MGDSAKLKVPRGVIPRRRKR